MYFDGVGIPQSAATDSNSWYHAWMCKWRLQFQHARCGGCPAFGACGTEDARQQTACVAKHALHGKHRASTATSNHCGKCIALALFGIVVVIAFDARSPRIPGVEAHQAQVQAVLPPLQEHRHLSCSSL